MNLTPVNYTPTFAPTGASPTPPSPTTQGTQPFTASSLQEVQHAVDDGRISAAEGLKFAQAMQSNPHTWGAEKSTKQMQLVPVDYTPNFTGAPKTTSGFVHPTADPTKAIEEGNKFFAQHDVTMQLINAARDGKLQKWLESPWHLKADLHDAPKNLKKGVAAVVKEAVRDPMGFVASTLKGMAESPEMFLAGNVGGGLVKRVVGGAAVNAGLGMAGSVGSQLQKTGTVDPGQVVQAGAGGVVTGGLLGGMFGHGAPKDAATPPPEPVPTEPPVAPPEAPLTLAARNDPAQLHQELEQHTAQQAAEAPKKVRLVEGHVLGENAVVPYDHPALELPNKQSTLDKAVAKVREGRKFAMTSEERIQWERLGKGEQRIATETKNTSPTKAFPQQPSAKTRIQGKADVDLLKKLGIAAGGAVAFNYLDPEDKWRSAATGAALALTGAWLTPHVREGLKADSRLRIDKYTNDFEGTSEVAKVRLHGFVQNIRKAVTDPTRRVAITHFLDGEKVDLSPEEQKVAGNIRAFFDQAAKDLISHGLMDAARADYVTHLWDMPQNKGRMGGGITTRSPFTKARTYSTLAEGKAAGLVPKTEDVADIVHTYGSSANQAIAGKTLIDTLRELQGPDGRKLILPAANAPQGYEPVNLPQLRGSLVHPDIALSLRMFESG